MQQRLTIKNAQQTYRKQDVMTASPMELVLMLYDGIRKNIMLARRAIERKDIESAHDKLVRAYDIVMELINCLDLSIPLSAELLKIYEFMLFALKEANFKKDAALLADVLEISENLRSAWQEVSTSVRDGMLDEAEEDV